MRRLAALHRRLAARHSALGFLERSCLLLLIPWGWLYGMAGRFRAGLYERGLRRSYHPGVPVIAVGNLTVGGTGKTPVVDHVVKYLVSLGWKVAVVSRGYGGTHPGSAVVSAGSGPLLSPEVCGDEPYLLALRNPLAIVLVAHRRPQGMRLAVERFGAEVIVLDDGFQHLAAARDLDIVLLDARAPLGNGHVLPAGVLREIPSALQRGDVFLLTRWREGLPAEGIFPLPGPLLHSRHRLDERAIALDGGEVPLSTLAGKKGIAFAGIADPEAFFADLLAAGLTLAETIPFPDHAGYGETAMGRLQEAGARGDYLITTEKDAVKLQGRAFPVPCYRVPLRLEILEAGELENILQALLADGGTYGHFARPS